MKWPWWWNEHLNNIHPAIKADTATYVYYLYMLWYISTWHIPAVMVQWLVHPTCNHKVAGSRPTTAMMSLGIVSLNRNWVPDRTRWLCDSIPLHCIRQHGQYPRLRTLTLTYEVSIFIDVSTWHKQFQADFLMYSLPSLDAIWHVSYMPVPNWVISSLKHIPDKKYDLFSIK
jgi:hypothetical protein